MSKGLQWVIGISVVILVAAFAFNLVAPFFMPTTASSMMTGPMLAQHAAMMNGGMMPQGGMMMQGGGMMGNVVGRWGVPFMGGGLLLLGLLLALVGLLGFWLGRRAKPQAQPVVVKEATGN